MADGHSTSQSLASKTCIVCGQEFAGPNYRICSDECNRERRNSRRLTPEQKERKKEQDKQRSLTPNHQAKQKAWREANKGYASAYAKEWRERNKDRHQEHDRRCQWCSGTFASRRGKGNRFCSRDCAFASKAEGKRLNLLRLAEAKKAREQARLALRAERKKADEASRERTCKVCGSMFQKRHSERGYCSTTCFRLHYREMKRDAKRRRHALKKGCSSEPYKAKDIFKRDQWRCWICGKKTNRKTLVPHGNAPTIDHVIPLSKGGPDSPSNVACACFKCNLAKSDDVLTLW